MATIFRTGIGNKKRLAAHLKDIDTLFYLLVMVFTCLLFVDRGKVNVVLFAVLPLFVLKIRKNGFHPTHYLYVVLVFIAGILVSLVDSTHLALGLDEIRKMMKWIFLPIIFLQFQLKKTEKEQIVYPVFLATCVYFALAAIEFFSGGTHRIDAGYNISQYSINLAFMIVLYSAFLLWPVEDSRKRMVATIGLAVSAGLLIMAGTRGVWISTLVCMTAMLLLKKKYVVLAGLFSVLVLVVSGALVADFGMFSTRLKNYHTAAIRLDIYAESYRLFREHPINGIGYANFSNEQDVTHYVQKKKRHSHPHNMMLKMACETGLIGLLCYVVFKGFIFLYLWRRVNFDWMVFAVFHVFLVLELYDLFTINIKKHFSYAIAFFLLGIAMQAIHAHRSAGMHARASASKAPSAATAPWDAATIPSQEASRAK